MTHKLIKQTAIISCLFVSLFVWGACSGVNENIQVTGLRCEYMDQALGIDHPYPRFTWQFEGNDPAFEQKRYRIQVATTPELLAQGKADVWTSDKIKSPRSLAVYAGDPLASHTRYYWNVRVWDEQGHPCAPSATASFEPTSA